MGAFDAVLSLGLAIAYVFAGPVLNALGAQGVYLVGGVTATAATLVLLPMLRVRDEVPADLTSASRAVLEA